MEFSAKQISQFIQGRIEGDENVTINTFAKIEEGKKGAISFLANPKYIHYLFETESSIVLIDEDIQLDKEVKPTLIRVKNARDCVAKLLQLYESMKPKKQGIDSLAFVSSKATIGKDVYGAFAYIGDGVTLGDGCQIYPHATIMDGVQLGNNCIVYPNASIYHGCKIGNNVILHSGCVIGADGFGFAPNPETNSYDKIPQIGIVTIEDDVEIGANTCIDRSTMGSTYVRKGVKLDNLVQIAHNNDIGENTVMSAQVGIAGSTKVGQWCMFGGQVGIAGHITIGDKVFLGAQSGVPGSLKSNQQLIGTPPMEQRPYFKSQAIFQRLPEMYKQLNALQKEIEELKKEQITYMETVKQKTLKGSFSLFGKGLHTGLSLTVTFNPAPENTGYKIQRIDLDGQPIIDAVAENVVDTQRGTVLAKGEARVSTIEHGMSALYAMGIDNCLIQINGPEFPILDGSATMYVDKINEVGIVDQNAPKDYYIIRKKIEIKDENGSVITILPDEQFSITAMCNFDSKFISSQFATLDDINTYATEIAPARTFVFVRDIMPLLQANLIKGGDLDNAIVIYEQQVSQEKLDQLADLLKVSRMDANNIGYIQHKPLQWDNECTRHKLLDIIGDMALIGKPIKGRIIATRPGHTVNNKFARLMRKEIRKHEIQAPMYDPNEEPLMDNIRIRELLPHRYPMQLVDKVIAMGSTSIVGIKNVTSNEPFFQGHFPQEPVMPGVLQVEAMAQCGGLLVLSQVEEPERWSTYFLKIDDVKFRQKVIPGDTLMFRVELLGPVRHGISSMKGYMFVGERVVAEATFTAQIVKNK